MPSWRYADDGHGKRATHIYKGASEAQEQKKKQIKVSMSNKMISIDKNMGAKFNREFPS